MRRFTSINVSGNFPNLERMGHTQRDWFKVSEPPITKFVRGSAPQAEKTKK